MNAEIINPFITATLHVLQTIAAGTETKPLKLYIKQDQLAKGDISGLMEVKGSIDGTVALTFSKGAILSIVSKMFQEEMKEINNDIKDAVGEIINMITGQASQKFVELKQSLKAVALNVIMGQNHTIPHIIQHPILSIPFKMQEGKFIIEIAFKD